MTLIVGIQCTDGVVIAADSASTDGNGYTKQPATKITQLGDLPVLVGASGDVGLTQKIRESLDEQVEAFRKKAKLKNLRPELKRVFLTECDQSHKLYLAVPNTPIDPPIASLLVVGKWAGQFFVLEIDPSGKDTIYTPEMGGFYAIGSGSVLAHALFRQHLFRVESRTVEVGKVLAYRVLSDAIELAGSYLALPVNMFTIDSTGSVQKTSSEEMLKLASTCEFWREREAESLTIALQGEIIGEAAHEIPVPEPA